jgi:hypothetical protein
MDNFDLKPEPRAKRNPLLWNLLTVVVLLGICGLVYFFFTIFSNPYSRLNPFPPQPTPTNYQTITPTITIIQLPPTWTYTPTTQPSPSRTKAPTWTALPGLISPTVTDTPETPTPTPITETPTTTPTPMPASVVITDVASTTIHADSTCNWIGVGGKVLDANGKDLQFQTIQLGGTFNGKTVNRTMLSGSAPAYGPSGFEFVLGEKPLASTQQLWIQLFDNGAKPLTDKIYFDTFTDCSKNLVMVVFTKDTTNTQTPTWTSSPTVQTSLTHTSTPTQTPTK